MSLPLTIKDFHKALKQMIEQMTEQIKDGFEELLKKQRSSGSLLITIQDSTSISEQLETDLQKIDHQIEENVKEEEGRREMKAPMHNFDNLVEKINVYRIKKFVHQSNQFQNGVATSLLRRLCGNGILQVFYIQKFQYEINQREKDLLKLIAIYFKMKEILDGRKKGKKKHQQDFGLLI